MKQKSEEVCLIYKLLKYALNEEETTLLNLNIKYDINNSWYIYSGIQKSETYFFVFNIYKYTFNPSEIIWLLSML